MSQISVNQLSGDSKLEVRQEFQIMKTPGNKYVTPRAKKHFNLLCEQLNIVYLFVTHVHQVFEFPPIFDLGKEIKKRNVSIIFQEYYNEYIIKKLMIFFGMFHEQDFMLHNVWSTMIILFESLFEDEYGVSILPIKLQLILNDIMCRHEKMVREINFKIYWELNVLFWIWIFQKVVKSIDKNIMNSANWKIINLINRILKAYCLDVSELLNIDYQQVMQKTCNVLLAQIDKFSELLWNGSTYNDTIVNEYITCVQETHGYEKKSINEHLLEILKLVEVSILGFNLVVELNRLISSTQGNANEYNLKLNWKSLEINKQKYQQCNVAWVFRLFRGIYWIRHKDGFMSNSVDLK